jgi:ATP-dependent protease ClpP protease subunit
MTLMVGGEMLLYGDVGASFWDADGGLTGRKVLEALVEHGASAITVRINSGGGDALEGVAIYNALKNHKGKVTVVVDSVAASAASIIMMAADDRAVSPGSFVMIHEPSTFSGGTSEDHEATAEVLDKVAAQMADIYSAATGMSAKDVRKLMKDETWMTAEEAVEKGFATRLTETAATGEAAMAAEGKAKITAEEIATNQAALAAKLEAAAKEEDDDEEDEDEEEDEDGKKTATASASEGSEEEDEPAARAAAPRNPVAVAPFDYVNRYRHPPAHIVNSGQRDPARAPNPKGPTMTTSTATRPAADNSRRIFNLCREAGIKDADVIEEITKAAGNKVIKAQSLIIDRLRERDPSPSGTGTTPHVVVTNDERSKFVAGASKGLAARAGVKGGERNEFSGHTLRELARMSLANQGFTAQSIPADPMRMIEMAFNPYRYNSTLRPRAEAGMHSTSDFAELLANSANKSMLIGYEEVEETFPLWTAKGSLPDFKTATRLDLGLFPSLRRVNEGAEFKSVTLSERKATIALLTYGEKFAITRQTIINDDLSAFTRLPRIMGRGAKRTVGDLVIALITSNADAPDGTDLFHVDHANLASVAARPTVASISAARAAMALQKDVDENGTALGLRPAFALVPVEVQAEMDILMASQFDPAADKLQVPNAVRGLATVIPEARLSAASATAWYLFASPTQTETIEVSYLNGVEEPFMEERAGFDVDGVEFKVRIDAGVGVMGHKGAYKNAGTA